METKHFKKLKWTSQEDQCLIEAVRQLGTKSWKAVAQNVPGRSGKQCRERWLGQLSPSVVKDHWTIDEDLALIRAQKLHGNKWSIIATTLPGRSPISVKNRWSWLTRHGVTNSDFSSPEVIPSSPQPEKAKETSKPGWKYLTPIELPDSSLFGAGFIKFQQTLNVL